MNTTTQLTYHSVTVLLTLYWSVDYLYILYKSSSSFQAVFRKLLSSSKPGKHRASNLKFKGGDSNDVAPPPGEETEAFEARKQDWQQELEQLSEFLLQKSTQEQQVGGD